MAGLVIFLAGMIGLGLIWLMVVVARRSQPYRVEPEVGRTHYRHGVLLRIFAVFSLFGSEALILGWILIAPPPPEFLKYTILAGFLLGIVGMLLVWEAYRFHLTTTPTTLTVRSPWRGNLSSEWSQVVRLSYSQSNAWFVLHIADGRTFRVSVVVGGIQSFLAECEKHLPESARTESKPGYRWVGRAWPMAGK